MIDAERRAKLDLLEAEKLRRIAVYRHRGSLYEFVRHFWPVLEPETPLVDGWAMHAVCVHLEAVAKGEINRLLINVPPGFSKSLLCNVFFPAWLWGPAKRPHLRMLKFSYAASLTERDNAKLRDLILSQEYQRLYGDVFELKKVGETKITNSKTGSALATSVGGVGTGERGDLVVVDDPHSVKESESDAVRGETVRWFREALSNRLNDMEKSSIIVIMQRVHEGDVSGSILSEGLGYTHLMIPMEYDIGRHCQTSIGWSDPRTEDGELAWPERFPPTVVAEMRNTLGPYAYAGQYQQSPAPRGGGIFQREWWQLWAEDTYPPLEFVLVSADTAYTQKESNDPSACTVWGLWRENGAPRIVMIYAWRKFLSMHGKYEPRYPGETTAEFEARTKSQWGLVEWLAWTCRRYKADKLIIEGKASGLTAVQEIQRLHGTEGWGVQVVQPHGDKVARAHAVQPIFSQLLVYAPDRDWADMVMDEMQSFPRGRYKDLTDSTTQAMKFFRESGLIVHRHEIEYAEDEMRQYRRRSQPLYPV